MNREIKFRVWDIDCKSMEYAPMLGVGSGTTIDGWFEMVARIDQIAMQFTGLTDKNGKEIFEGDIIKTPLGHICIIKWDHVREVKTDDTYEYTGFCYHNVAQSNNYHFDEAHRCEVIGNIHEHPHLLKA